MEKLIAYCGLDCAQCGAYLAHKNNDQALREKTAAEWKVAHNFDFTPEMINCSGCKGTGVLIGHCQECEMRKCAIAKGLVICGACFCFLTSSPVYEFKELVLAVRGNLAG